VIGGSCDDTVALIRRACKDGNYAESPTC